MNLKEYVLKLSEETKYEDLSSFSIYSIVMHNLSKQEYFKDSFSHVDLIEHNNEIRMLSNYINNASGFVNTKYKTTVMDENIIDEGLFLGLKGEQEPDEYGYYDEVYLDYSKTKSFIPNKKLNELNKINEIISESETFKDVVFKFENSPELFKTLSQYIINNNYKVGYNLKDFSSLLMNMALYEKKDHYYRLKNKNRSLGSTNDRDIFGSTLIGALLNKNEEDGLEYLKSKRFHDVASFLSRGDYPKEIKDLFDKRDDYSNEELISKALHLYYGEEKKYESSNLKICLSNKSSEEKRWELINSYFDDSMKNIIQKEFDDSLNNFLSKESLIERHKDVINKIEESVYKEFPKLKNNEVDSSKLKVEIFEFEGGDYSVASEKMELLNTDKYELADLPHIDKKMRGFCFADTSSIENRYVKDKTFLITVKSDDDLLAFGDYYIDNGRIRTNNINVGTGYRGNRLSSMIFEKIMDKSVELNLPLATTHYTDSGETHLPSQKKRMLSKRKDVLWIDVSCNNDLQSPAEKMFSDINDPFIRILKDDYSMLPIKKVREVYDSMITKYDEILSKELSFDEKYSMKFTALEDIQSELKKEKLKLTQKKKNKFKPR